MLSDASLTAGTGLPAQPHRCRHGLGWDDVLARTSLEPQEVDELTTARRHDGAAP